MDIKQLVQKPKLISIEVDTPEVVEQFGDTIIFYMKDHLDLGTYFDFYKLQQSEDVNQLTVLLRKIILDKDGNQAIADDEVLPVDITLAILFKINEYLGKSKAKVPTQSDGKVQN